MPPPGARLWCAAAGFRTKFWPQRTISSAGAVAVARPRTDSPTGHLRKRFTTVVRWLVGELIESGFGTRPEGVDERTFVVRYGDELIGTVTLSLRAGRGGVYGFVIAPQWRGRGIGREVLARACTLLRDEGAQEIGLEVLTDNEHALGLYTSVGFDPFVTEDYYELDVAARVPSPA